MDDRDTIWDWRFLGLAQHIAGWSKDPSTKVGAVIVSEHRNILATGYNGFPRGVPDEKALLDDRNQKYPRVVHAEANALLQSPNSHDATIYVTMMPCADCAGLIIQAGIKRVVSPPLDSERWTDSSAIAEEMFRHAGVELCLIETP